jgi:protein-tyrosine phosphatase
MQWWIDNPKLVGSHNPRQSELRIDNLTTIISLIDPSEEPLKYNPAIPGIKWIEIPVRDYTAPALEKLCRFVKIVEESPGTVLVHCEGGSGRTGTFGAAWLMRDSRISATDAIETLRKVNPCAVETDEQKAVLIRYENKLRNER